jgi:hypothetical protein
MKYAFSANRQASRKNGMPCERRMREQPRMFSRLTGCPPPVLFVIVSMPSGIRPWLRPQNTSSRPRSMFPLNGNEEAVSNASATTRSSASPPSYSMLARVVSKWLLLGMTDPGCTVISNRIRSAARPWCVGITCS